MLSQGTCPSLCFVRFYSKITCLSERLDFSASALPGKVEPGELGGSQENKQGREAKLHLRSAGPSQNWQEAGGELGHQWARPASWSMHRKPTHECRYGILAVLSRVKITDRVFFVLPLTLATRLHLFLEPLLPTGHFSFRGGHRGSEPHDWGFFGLEHADYFQVWSEKSQLLDQLFGEDNSLENEPPFR